MMCLYNNDLLRRQEFMPHLELLRQYSNAHSNIETFFGNLPSVPLIMLTFYYGDAPPPALEKSYQLIDSNTHFNSGETVPLKGLSHEN